MVATHQLTIHHTSLGQRGEAVGAGVQKRTPRAAAGVAVVPQHQLPPKQRHAVGPVGGEVCRHAQRVPLLQPWVGASPGGCS